MSAIGKIIRYRGQLWAKITAMTTLLLRFIDISLRVIVSLIHSISHCLSYHRHIPWCHCHIVLCMYHDHVVHIPSSQHHFVSLSSRPMASYHRHIAWCRCLIVSYLYHGHIVHTIFSALLRVIVSSLLYIVPLLRIIVTSLGVCVSSFVPVSWSHRAYHLLSIGSRHRLIASCYRLISSNYRHIAWCHCLIVSHHHHIGLCQLHRIGTRHSLIAPYRRHIASFVKLYYIVW